MTIAVEKDLDSFCTQVQSDPFEAMNGVSTYLDARKRGDGAAWNRTALAFREHPLHSLLLEDPYTARAFSKPRGYAGDAVMMDFIYNHPSVTDVLRTASASGRGMARYSAGNSEMARAVRWRRQRVAQEIERLVETQGTVDVLAFACGHLREFDLVRPDLRERVRFVAADADEASLATVRSSYSMQGTVECSHTSIRALLSGKAKPLGQFDLAYTLGLLDYVGGRASGRVVERLWETLKPGGSLLAANFTNTTRGSGYMEAAMDWWLEYRGPAEVGAWAQSLDGVQSKDLFEDPLRQIAYLLARKRQ